MAQRTKKNPACMTVEECYELGFMDCVSRQEKGMRTLLTDSINLIPEQFIKDKGLNLLKTSYLRGWTDAS